MEKFINIQFPFQNSRRGFFLAMTKTDADAIKSDLTHLLLTRKGERLYNPDFGTNLLRFIFEPNDGFTQSQLKQEISDTVKRYIPNLKIDDVVVEISTSSEHVAIVRVNYTITEDVFEQQDFVIIQI